MCILGVPQEGSSNAYITPQTATSTGFGIYNCKANCFGEGTFSKLANVSLSSIGLTPGGNYQVTGLQVDLGDNGLIVGLHGITGTTGSATFKWLNGTVVWHTNAIAIGGDGAAGGTNGSLVTNGLLGFYDGAFRAFMMPTATGALGWDTNAVGFGSGTANSPTPTGHDTTFLAFDGTNRSVIMIDGNNYQIVRQFLGCGSGGPEGLDSIVSDILQRAGLTTSDFDVTALAAYSVQGYVVSKRSDAKQAIQQLSELFFFDCVESDTKLKFVVRGASPFISITQNDLGEARNAKGKKQNDSNYWKHTKKQEIETTEEFHVKFFDPYRNFQVGDQYYRRTGAPVATMDAKNIKILDVPLVMGPDQAAQIAQQSLFQEWVERDSYAASVGWKYLWMEPSDVATVTMNNGDVYTVRVDKVTTGLDLTMSCDFVATDSVTYTSTISGASGDGLIAPGSAVNTQVTTMMLLDLPLLRDADNPGDYNDLFYYGCIMTAGGTWPGGEVYRSTDSGATFAPDSAQSRTLLAGTVQGTLPVTYHPFMVDYSYTLTLFPYRGCSGTLTNATLDNVLSYNANALAINGEIIQFVNATLNSNGSYTLSGILRGCRGTEWMCNYHTVGEEWVYLDPTILANDVYTYAQVGMTWAYRATTFGSYVDAAPIKAVKLSGAALKPYPVVHFTRTISGSNLVIGWERRTRYSGGLMDGTGTAPLNEATEAYEIYILSSAYSPTTFDPTNPSTYVRKLTATTTQVTYTAAMMTADGFTAGSSPLYVVGYQISATVGRGFPGFDTVLAVP